MIAGLVRRFWLLGIIALIVIGVVIFRDRLSGAAADLNAGNCFDQPAETTEISDVQRQPCNEAHDAEVFLVAEHPAADGDIYPISLTLNRFIDEQCEPAFNTYTGLDYDNEPDLGYSALIPTRESWNDGDREVTCFLLRIDDAKLTTSLRAASAT